MKIYKETMDIPGNYSMVAVMRGQIVIKYHEFGSYQGEWILVSKDSNNYHIYKGSYGSCSGCDDLEAEFNYGEIATFEKVMAFIEKYKPTISVPISQFEELYKSGQLLSIFPCNFRDEFSDVDLESFVENIKIGE